MSRSPRPAGASTWFENPRRRGKGNFVLEQEAPAIPHHQHKLRAAACKTLYEPIPRRTVAGSGGIPITSLIPCCWRGPGSTKQIQRSPQKGGQVGPNSRGGPTTPPLVYFTSKRGEHHIKQAEGPLLGQAKFRQTGGDANGYKGPTMGGRRPPPFSSARGTEAQDGGGCRRWAKGGY